jgi:hypothetical protein
MKHFSARIASTSNVSSSGSDPESEPSPLCGVEAWEDLSDILSGLILVLSELGDMGMD